MKRLDQIKDDFRHALTSLEEAVSQAKSDLEIDGSIQRFEFTYELFWKLLKTHLQREGIVANTLRECFKEAYKLGLLGDEEGALTMIEDRNLTVHLYDKDSSRTIFERIKSAHIEVFRATWDKVVRRET
jgi:nucleotidyltransferase substrate binding protein (TIGR01987 family)